MPLTWFRGNADRRGNGFALLEALVVVLLLAVLGGPVFAVLESVAKALAHVREETVELLRSEAELRKREAELSAPRQPVWQ